MIDHGTYHKMDKGAAALAFDRPEFQYSHDTLPMYLKPEAQPSQEMISLLSPTIYGFHLSEKRWIHLHLDSVDPVSWNKKAFDKLALPDG